MLFINLEPIFIFFKWTLDATIFQATSLRRSSVCRFLYRFLFQIKSLSVSLPSCVVSRRWNDLRCRRLCVLAVVDFGGVFRVFRASFRAIGRSWRHRRRRRLLFLFVVPYFVGWKEMETIFFSYLSLFVPLSFGISDVRVFSSLSTEFPPYFTGFYWVLLGFTGLFWVLLHRRRRRRRLLFPRGLSVFRWLKRNWNHFLKKLKPFRPISFGLSDVRLFLFTEFCRIGSFC